jgi:superfamily II DNA or RNA helicase
MAAWLKQTGKQMIKPWDWQWDIIEQVRGAIASGYRKILVVVPTGGGKTVIAAQIVKLAAEKGRRSMFLAHRRELIYQSADKLVNFGVDHGILMAGEYPYGAADCQVASVDTLRARCITTDKLPLPNSDVVIIDEAHRSLAPTYVTLINHYGEEVVIGITATPIRGDGKGLGHVYDYMVCGPSIAWMIANGYLCEPVTFAPNITDLTGVKVRGGDYDPKELQRAMDRRSLVGGIVEHWHRLASDRPTIVFASGVKHSIHLRDEFRKAGAVAAHVDGDTSLEDRKQIIADLSVGKVQVVCNYAVFTEGFDEPSLSCNILARPTKNLGLYLQMAGRTLRVADNKENCFILDHSGNVYEHGFVQDEHDWILEEGKALHTSKEDRQKEFDEKKPITCVKCATVYTGQLPCPHCGHIPEKYGKFVESRSGDLMEIRAEKRKTAKKKVWTSDEKRYWYSMLLGHAQLKNKSTGWVSHTFKSKFGVWPNHYKDTPASEPNGEVKAYIRHRNIAYAKRMEKINNAKEKEEQSAAGR